MVYQDISGADSEKNKNSFTESPNTFDRFFSFLIDYLVLSPFVIFGVYLLFKDGLLFWKLHPEAPEQNSLLFLLVLGYVSLFSLFQAIFITLFQATPGQYYLKIQIQFESNTSLIFLRAFCRQIGFWLSALFLGLPLLAVLFHNQRKTFYERWADCRLVSLKKHNKVFSFELENKYWQSLFATLTLFLTALFISVVWLKYEKIVQRTASFKALEKNNFFCKELKDVQLSGRLSMAVAMNLVGQLSDSCLDKEADFVLWKDKTADISLAYYAKSLTEESTEKEKKYLTQACESEKDIVEIKKLSMGCLLARSFLNAEFEELYAELSNRRELLSDTMRYELTDLIDKGEQRDKNYAKLERYDSHKLYKKYLLTEELLPEQKNTRSPASDETDGENKNHQEQVRKWIDEL